MRTRLDPAGLVILVKPLLRIDWPARSSLVVIDRATLPLS